jgi:hypothetical protein
MSTTVSPKPTQQELKQVESAASISERENREIEAANASARVPSSSSTASGRSRAAGQLG